MTDGKHYLLRPRRVRGSWCYIPLQALEAGDGYVDYPDWFNKREAYKVVQDLADNQEDPRRGGNPKANGPYNPDWFKKREADEVVQDLADNLQDPRRGGKWEKVNGPYHHSKAHELILPIYMISYI